MVIEGGSDESAHDIAVNIAFTKPTYLSRYEVPQADIDDERATVTEIWPNEGKPEAALDKEIVDGRMNGRSRSGARSISPTSRTRSRRSPPSSVRHVVAFAQVVIGA